MVYTIADVSKMLNSSKQTIYNKLKEFETDLKPHISKNKGITYISIEGLSILKSKGFQSVSNNLNEFESHKDRHITDLQKQLEYFRDEINRKNNQIEHLQIMLDREREQTLMLEGNIERASNLGLGQKLKSVLFHKVF